MLAMWPKSCDDVESGHDILLQLLQFTVLEVWNFDELPYCGLVVEVKVTLCTLDDFRCPRILMPPAQIDALHVALVHEVIVALRRTPYQIVVPLV